MRSALFLAGVVLLGCPAPKKVAQDPAVIATVNGELISKPEFEAELSRELQALDTRARSPEQIEPFKRALLQTLIERALLLQAAKTLNVTVAPEEVDRRVLRLASDYPAQGFDEALSSGQLSGNELRRKTAILLTIEKLFREHLYPRVAVTEEEIRSFHESHAEQLQAPEEVRASQLVVKDLEEAKRLLVQLKAGKKFADLARRYSLSPDAKVGGDLGFFPRGQMPPSFDEVVFKLNVNQVSEVVSTEYGYQLFKLVERRPARKRELAETRPQIEERLLREAREKAQTAYLKSLKDKAEVHINEVTLSAATGKSRAGPAGFEP